MINLWPFKREPKIEKRAAMAAGYTSELIGLRQAYISGRTGLGELCGVVQACSALWENCFAMSDVDGADLLTRDMLAMTGRALALRGEAVLVIDDNALTPASDWEVATRRGRPIAYRLGLPDAGGGRSETRLAGEVLHFKIGVDASAPWTGQSPLRRARLTAEMLHSIETVLQEVAEFGALGSMVLPMPEQPEVDLIALGKSFRAERGRLLFRESVAVTAAGGPQPQADWRPESTSPDLSKSMSIETLNAARNSIASVYGVLPSLFSPDLTGPQTREIERFLVQFTLQPMLSTMAEECSTKLGYEVSIDAINALQSFDASGKARSFATLIEGLAAAKAAGISEEQVAAALKMLNWQQAE